MTQTGPMPSVVVYTQVYNAAPYLEQCVRSVLSQTYPNFVYLILDNGSTDGSKQILEKFSVSDPRIQLICVEKNVAKFRLFEFFPLEEYGGYFTNLDADDWWEKDYLERLVRVAVETASDIVCTGTLMHIQGSTACSTRSVQNRMVLSHAQYAEAFPYYHVFFRPIWAKLIRISILLKAHRILEQQDIEIIYGLDTLTAFACLRNAERMCVDDSVLHHYRIHRNSVSYRYDPRRFEADVYLYNDAINFLLPFGPISAQNRNFIQCVYSNAIIDTARVIQSSNLSPADKLREYHTVAAHPITQAVFCECTYESAKQSKTELIVKSLAAGAGLKKADDDNLRITMQVLLPNCWRAVFAANAQLFLKDPQLLQALLRDDAEEIQQDFLSRIEQNQGVKKYNIAVAVQALAIDDLLLCQIDDAVFMRKYTGIYRLIWKGERLTALDEMTGMLLENKVSSARETFLSLFIALAAVENQPPAFVFGKLQMGRLYLQQNRLVECHTLVAELKEMGLTDNAELSELVRKLRDIEKIQCGI